MDPKEFISQKNGCVIAPAGYGKTHAISDCVIPGDSIHLILTHTHAGVASIREKIKRNKPDLNNYQIETITGYAQKYVQAYYRGDDIPSREESDSYYKFIVEKATEIFTWPLVKDVVRATFSRLFVDEYQDCSIGQHRMILSLSHCLPTYILGDPLQGIFNFKGELLVDMNDDEIMKMFSHNKQELPTPWRWKDKNVNLGNRLKNIRELILAKSVIDLTIQNPLEYINIADENELYKPSSEYYKSFNKLLKFDDLLIIYPESTSIYPRRKIIGRFKIPISLIESIDDKDFYKFSKVFDWSTTETIEVDIAEICHQLFNKTVIDRWFTGKGLKRKKNEKEAALSAAIKNCIEKFRLTGSKTAISNALNIIDSLPDIRCYRRELFYALCNSLVDAEEQSITVFESMEAQRQFVRKIGRRNKGRCIGTTLLTKGLEFENVIILNAHKFDCPKNLYVALTRASKNLYVFSKGNFLGPFNGS